MAFPYLLYCLFSQFFKISYELLDLVSKKTHIIRYLTSFLYPLIRLFLYLTIDLGIAFLVGLHPQESRAIF